ncbi:MAG: hypothetical protein ACK2UB_02910 [Anaerolineales bacterium]
MDNEKQKPNPIAFIAIGVCFMGAGVALGAALHSSGGSGVGIGLTGIGVVFLIVGAIQSGKKQ